MQNKAIRQKCCCSSFNQSLLQAGLGMPVDWALQRYLYTIYLPSNIDKIIHIKTRNEGALAVGRDNFNTTLITSSSDARLAMMRMIMTMMHRGQ